MGTAFLARAQGTDGFERLVVIKRLHSHLTNVEKVVLRFLDEARLAAAIYHANVIGTQYAGQDEQGYLLVLDYIEGASLDALIDRASLSNKHVPVSILLRIALDTLAGLQAVHTACDAGGRPLQILHRDISLQNLLVGRDGLTRVADFGIAKSSVRAARTTQGTVMGKLIYLPREHLNGGAVGPSLDTYSVGVTLWIALANDEPWFVDTEAQLVKKIMTSRVPRLSERMEIDPRLDALIAKATDPDPMLRFQTALEMALALENVLKNSRLSASHADVARFVGELLDVDLERRRARIRTLVDPGNIGASVALESTNPIGIPLFIESTRQTPRGIPGAATTKLSHGISDAPVASTVLSPPHRPKRARTFILAAAGIWASGLCWFAALRSVDTVAFSPTRPNVAQAAQQPAAIPTHSQSIQVAPVMSSALAVAGSTSAAPASRSALNPPTKVRVPKTNQAKASKQTTGRPPPLGPDHIAQKNPYRVR